MQIEIFCLCKGATVNRFNEPTLIDIFDVKVAAGEPAWVEAFLVAISMRVYRSDEGNQIRLSIICKDESGNVVLGPITDIIGVARLPRESTTFFQQYHVPAGALRFGTYTFSIEIDGKLYAQTPLYVALGSNQGRE